VFLQGRARDPEIAGDDGRALAVEESEHRVRVLRLVQRAVTDAECLECLGEVVAQRVLRDSKQRFAGIPNATQRNTSLAVSPSDTTRSLARVFVAPSLLRYCDRAIDTVPVARSKSPT
jgi:hypothetical protein